jgi:hypothetical protein
MGQAGQGWTFGRIGVDQRRAPELAVLAHYVLGHCARRALTAESPPRARTLTPGSSASPEGGSGLARCRVRPS